MNELINNILSWANDKGLLFDENSKNQYIKCVEEIGEVGSEILKGNRDGIRNEIGDGLVTMIILSNNNGLSIEDCLYSAWNKIKDRKGKTVKGTFVKE